MTEPTKRLWPLQQKNVLCSGLRGVRVGIVHGQAWRWRVYCPQLDCPRWKVTRVRIRDVNDSRDNGEEIEAAQCKSRTEAFAAIERDADVLDEIGPLPTSLSDFGTRGAD